MLVPSRPCPQKCIQKFTWNNESVCHYVNVPMCLMCVYVSFYECVCFRHLFVSVFVCLCVGNLSCSGAVFGYWKHLNTKHITVV